MEVNSTLHIECNDGGGGTEVSRDVRHIAGQAWRWSSVHTRNDDPSPQVEVGLSRANVMLGDSAYWLVQPPERSGWEQNIGGDMTAFEYMIVRVECDGNVSNNNDFAGDFTVYGRIVEHTGMSVNPATIDQNGSSNISWSGAHAWYSWVTISDGGQTIQKGGDPNGSFSSGHTYTNGGYVGTVNVETCVAGYSWANEWTSICRSRDITVEALVVPTVDILCAGGNGPCTINQGDSINISWSESNASSCWTTGGGPDSSWPRDPIVPRGGGSENRGPLTVAGTYNYTYKCDNANGSDSDSVTVYVNAPVPLNSAQFISQSVPKTTLAPSETMNVSVTMRNCRPTNDCTGLNTWADTANYRLGSQNPQDNNTWGIGRVLLPAGTSILPGSQYTFPFTITAPATTGTYNFQWRMLQEAVEWFGDSSTNVSITVANNPPTASSVKATEPDYCIFGPSITISWVYTDPEGTTQSAYQVQIDDNAGFSSPNYDSGKILSSSTAIYAQPLTWNTTYRARVMVWDGSDSASAWATQTLCQGPPANPSGCSGDNKSWKSPNNQYPSGLNTFSWTPAKPAVNKPVQFDDGSTTCYKTPPNTVDTCLAWNWIFGDGGTSTLRDPAHTYTNTGSYNVNLKATDQQNGYTCGYSKTLNVQKPIPFWKEVLPQ